MMVFPVQAFAFVSQEKPSEKISGDINGIFEISIKTKNNWENAGNLSFGRFQETKEIDLGKYLKSDNALVKITQKGGGASYLDAVFLSGAAPVKANGSDGKILNKLAEEDLDIAPAGDGIVLEFPANNGEGILSVTGRIENEVISTQPLQFPAGNNFKFKEEIKDFYTYSLGSNIGTVNVDGILDEVETIKPFVKDYRIPDSGHPSGDSYFWVMNDNENLYVTMDSTPDNTYDGDKDYAKVYVDTGEGIKEFKVSVPENTWGNTKFTYTDKVEYEHKVYEFKIPLREISTKNFNDIKLSFVLYGTASYKNNCNNPALAYDSTNNIYLCVFEQLMYYDEFLYNRIVGEFVDKNGEPISPRFLIDNINSGSNDKGGIDLSNPSVVFNPKRNEFFVTWIENGIENYSDIDYVRAAGIEYDENDTYNMYNTTINPFNVSYNESKCEIKTPKISYDSENNEYLIVWSEYDDAYSIYGQFLNADGTLKGSRFNISTTDGVAKSYPSISYSESQESFLVAWENGDNIAACGVKSLEDNNVHVSNMSIVGEGRNPDVSYNYSNQFLFVTWENNGIFGRYFDLYNKSGTNYLDPVYKMDELKIREPHDGYDVGYPSSYYDGYRNMLTVWDLFKAEGDCYAELCYIDIYANPEGSPFYTDGDLSNRDNIEFSRMPIAISGDNGDDGCQNIIAYILKQDNEVVYRIFGDITEPEDIAYIQCEYPDIAYDDNGMYLSVFEYKPYNSDRNPIASYIYGEIIDRDGYVLSEKFPIYKGSSFNYEPTVAYDKKSGNFLVAWASPTGENSYTLMTRTVTLDETYILGEVHTLFDDGSVEIIQMPDLCYGKDGEFLLVWRHNLSVYGKIIDSLTELDNDSIEICSGELSPSNPSVAYSPIDQAFLVTWDYYSDTELMIGGRTVTTTGELSDSINIGGERRSFPNVSFNNSNESFLITYHDISNNPIVIKGQYVKLKSELKPETVNNEINISPENDYIYAIYPASYSDGKGKMLSAWTSTLFENNIYNLMLQYTDEEGNYTGNAFYPNEYDENYTQDNLGTQQISMSGDNEGKVIVAYDYEPEELYEKSIYKSYEYKIDIRYLIFGENELEPYIEFDREIYEVEAGNTTQAKVALYNFFPALYEGTNEGIDVTDYVTYEFDSDYITVDESGVITGVNPTPENEPATILAYLNPPEPELAFSPMDYSEEEPVISEDALIAEAKVIVTKAKEPGLEFVDAPYSVEIGKSTQAKVKYFDGIEYIYVPYEEFEYKSENPEIAAITSGGAITGVAVGTTTISAAYRTFINDVPTTLSAITSVNVYKKSEPRPASAPEKPIIGQVLVDNKVVKNIYPEDLVSDGGIYSFEASKTGDNAKLWLSGSYYKQIADKNLKGALRLVWDAASYTLPLKCENVLKEVNNISGSKVNIILEKADDRGLIESASAAVDKLNGKIVSGLVNFEVTVEGKSKVSIDSYDLYVERTINQIDKQYSYSTTAMKLLEDDEVFTFAPSLFDGSTATIKYRGNGIFAVTSNPKTFNDISNHWGRMNIEKLSARNIAFGKSEGIFAPNDFITRAEFAVMITRALGITEEEGTVNFDDVEGWFAEDISTAYDAGLINGKSDGNFHPNEKIQRKDMAVIIHNAIKFADKEATVKNTEKVLSMFADSPEIDGYARESTAICADAGIILGRDNGEFDPDENATRAEASAIVERMLRYLEFIN